MSDVSPPEQTQISSFEANLQALKTQLETVKGMDFEQDWKNYAASVEQKQKEQYGNELDTSKWFIVPENCRGKFSKTIDIADTLASSINNIKQVRQILWLLKFQDDQTTQKFFLYTICRRLSIEENQITIPIIKELSESVKDYISASADSDEKKDAVFSIASTLTAFGAKWGAEAFLLGLARAKFVNNNTRNQVFEYLEKNVHPNLYSVRQFVAAGIKTYGLILSDNLENARKNILEVFDRIFTPKEEEVYEISPSEQYAKTGKLTYPQGDANIENDFLILYDAGLDPTDIVFDPAVGEGRHFIPLWQNGYDITGGDNNLDFLKTITSQVKSCFPYIEDRKLVNLDWNQLPFKQNSFNFITMLGRDLHHLMTTKERQDIFGNLRKIIKEEGTFVVDFGDPTYGDYQVEAEEIENRFSHWRPDWETESELILDSMNDIHFTLRSFPSVMQILKEAQKNGFTPVNIFFKMIPETNKRNIYFVFKAV